jgi:hypothetical protein
VGEKTAIVEMRRAIEAHEAALGAPQLDRAVTLEAAAADWLHHLEHVDGAKPSTLADYRYMLAVPDAPAVQARPQPARRTGDACVRRAGVGRHHHRSGRAVARGHGSRRGVQAHHQQVPRARLLGARVRRRRPQRYGITANVVRATAKRREAAPGALDFYDYFVVLMVEREARSMTVRVYDGAQSQRDASPHAERRQAAGRGVSCR